MPIEKKIAFRMGPATADFYHYWEDEVARDTAVARAKFRPERKPAAGAGMVLPAEVTVVISEVGELLRSDLAKEALAGAAGAAGKEVGKFIWTKLVAFFKRPHAPPLPDKVIIVIDRREILINPLRMPAEPPRDFLDLTG